MPPDHEHGKVLPTFAFGIVVRPEASDKVQAFGTREHRVHSLHVLKTATTEGLNRGETYRLPKPVNEQACKTAACIGPRARNAGPKVETHPPPTSPTRPAR